MAGNVSHKNLVYDLARHEHALAQWLERPTSIFCKRHGFDSLWGSQKIYVLINST